MQPVLSTPFTAPQFASAFVTLEDTPNKNPTQANINPCPHIKEFTVVDDGDPTLYGQSVSRRMERFKETGNNPNKIYDTSQWLALPEDRNEKGFKAIESLSNFNTYPSTENIAKRVTAILSQLLPNIFSPQDIKTLEGQDTSVHSIKVNGVRAKRIQFLSSHTNDPFGRHTEPTSHPLALA